MSNQDQKHDWRPGLVAGASDLPVGIISGAGGAAAADAILKKKLQSAPPERLARLEKLHGRVSHLGTGLIAGGAALAYADYMQRKHERELAEAKMSKVANVYLEKVAEQLTAEQQKALDRGYDRPSIRASATSLGHGLVGTIGGGAIGGTAAYLLAKRGKGLPVEAATIGTVIGGGVGNIAGTIHGYLKGGSRAVENNTTLDAMRNTHPDKVDHAIIRDGKKGYVGATAFTGVHGYQDTREHNIRYEEALKRLTKNRSGE